MVPLLKKLTLSKDTLKKKLKLIQFSDKTKWSMLLVLPKVKDSKVLLKDGESNTYKRNHTEVTEKLDVLDHGTQLELDSQSQELVNSVITIELKSIKKFTESEKVLTLVFKTMLPLTLILLIKTLPPSEDSFITVS